MLERSVSAFRERGLRAGVGRSAEPHCWSDKLNNERKADTMKTYSLHPHTVEPQKFTTPATLACAPEAFPQVRQDNMGSSVEMMLE
jgi:hypothetical protein